MSINTTLGALLPIVFCGCVLTLTILWMRGRAASQQTKAKQAFAEALASKNIKIDASDVRTKKELDGVIGCEVTYSGALFAVGDYRPNGAVFVRYYPRPKDDRDWSFWYPADPNP